MSDNLPDVAATVKALKSIAALAFNTEGDIIFDAASLLESLSARVTQAETEHEETVATMRAQRSTALTAVARLQTQIDSAPHAIDCPVSYMYQSNNCTCWKSPAPVSGIADQKDRNE